MGYFKQDGVTVQAFAIKRTVKCYREIAKIPTFASLIE